MTKHKQQKQQQQKSVSYSDVAKQQPPKSTIRKPYTIHASTSAPDPEPLINLDSDQASSSDEARNNKNPVPTKRARTISKNAMDFEISPPVPQQKPASSSDNFPQSEINTAPRQQLEQPSVDQTSKSSNPPYARPSNVDMLHQETAELNKENNNKET